MTKRSDLATRSEMQQGFEIIRSEMQEGFAQIIRQLVTTNVKLAEHTARLDSMDHRFDSMDARFDSMDDRLDSMDAHFDLMGQEIVNVRIGQDAQIQEILMAISEHFHVVEEKFECRLTPIEKWVGIS